jgi:hypothetical protein
MSGAEPPERRFTLRFLRVGCLSKRDEHDVADSLLAKAVGDEAGL